MTQFRSKGRGSKRRVYPVSGVAQEKLKNGWRRVKTQEDSNVSLWLEKGDTIISIVPWGSKDPNDASIRISDARGCFEIPAHYSELKNKTPNDIIDIVERAMKRRA